MAARVPTEEQAEIIRAARGATESLRINAYAGTGKTSTLEMLAPALRTTQGLALAFNKVIAQELSTRFPQNFQVKTLNALGHQALCKSIGNVELDARKLTRIAKAQGILWGEASEVADLVSLAMQKGIVPEYFDGVKGLVPDTDKEWEQLGDTTPSLRGIEAARGLLITSIKEGLAGRITFDDQIYLSVFFTGYSQRFGTVLVDEAQDLSPLNHKQIAAVASDRVIAVGDRRQAIYAWRGADAQSMDNIKRLKEAWQDHPLTTTFRCPQIIVERNRDHAPGFNAFNGAPRGEFIQKKGWFWEDIELTRDRTPYDAAKQHEASVVVLCRNNAPLVTLALKLLAQHIPAKVLGRDLGAGLTKITRKLAPEDTASTQEFLRRLEAWRTTEVSKSEANDDGRAEGIHDRADALRAIAGSTRTTGELRKVLADLFDDTLGGGVTLSSVHKSKGREWDVVVHLDPFRLPSKWAKTPEAKEQEANLHYVCETRAKHTLIEADLEGFI